MKTISPWFQTAALMSAIRHAICQSGNRTAGPTGRNGSFRGIQEWEDRHIDNLLNTESHEIDGAVLFHHSGRQ